MEVEVGVEVGVVGAAQQQRAASNGQTGWHAVVQRNAKSGFGHYQRLTHICRMLRPGPALDSRLYAGHPLLLSPCCCSDVDASGGESDRSDGSSMGGEDDGEADTGAAARAARAAAAGGGSGKGRGKAVSHQVVLPRQPGYVPATTGAFGRPKTPAASAGTTAATAADAEGSVKGAAGAGTAK